jgi:menaquinone-dependent protoporphyrinogen oxidase
MRVLVTYGSKMGGTAGLADMVGDALRQHGYDVDVAPADTMPSPAGYDAAVIGGALYAARWHRDARRFVARNRQALGAMPVWLFSSGPLDDSATTKDIPPVGYVRKAMTRIGARGHATFGGRLPTDPPGFMARAMAKKLAGDWRDPTPVRRWVDEIAAHLADAHVTRDEPRYA